MPRTVKLWVGKNDDAPVPPRVKLRVLEAQNHQCPNCWRRFDAKLKPEFDHHIAIINGGANVEQNIVALCYACHQPKTKTDVAEKSKVSKVKQKHLGIKPRKGHSLSAPNPKAWKYDWSVGRYVRITP